MRIYEFNGEEQSKDFKVKVGGVPVPVYNARVSAIPFNQVWPGYQRPLDQTEIASFVYWDMKNPVKIEIESNKPVKTCNVKPISFRIIPKIENNRITIEIKKPRYFTVEINGMHNTLHVFASPEKIYRVNRHKSDTIYFGPGIHKPGKIVLKDNQTVYIAGSAVVHASICAENVSNIKILGRGILDTSGFEREEAPGSISFYNCKNIKIGGIIIRDPNVWTVTINRCKNVEIENIKLIGLWRYNSDGIDICNSQKIKIKRCFIRSFDDSIVIKGLQSKDKNHNDNRPVKDVLVEGCVIWNDWGRALEFGAETCAIEIKNVIFKNCDIIRADYVAMDIQHGDCAKISNIKFENIRFEIDDENLWPLIQKNREEKYKNREEKFVPRLIVLETRKNMWKQCDGLGSMKNVYFKNIEVTGKHLPQSVIYGNSETNSVENVVIRNLKINGKRIKTFQDGNFKIGNFAKNIRIN